jgi:putative ABC transport system substrate-binding protein
MRRREFITLLGGVAAWPLAAHAQQTTMPVVGFVHILSPEIVPLLVPAFREDEAWNGTESSRSLLFLQ